MVQSVRTLTLVPPKAWSQTVYTQGGAEKATRPTYGVAGRSIALLANLFVVNLNITEVLQYNVEIEVVKTSPEGGRVEGPVGPAVNLPAKLARRILALLAAQLQWDHAWAFDGKKSLFLPWGRMVGVNMPYTITISDDHPRSFQVVLSLQSKVDLMSIARFIQGHSKDYPKAANYALDVILRHGAALRPNCTPFAHGLYFHDPTTTRSLGGGVEAWLGYQQSVKITQSNVMINLDSAVTSFMESKEVITLISEMLNLRGGVQELSTRKGLTPEQHKRVSKALAGSKVVLQHTASRQRQRITGITDKPASDVTFFYDKEDRNITVAEYFQKQYQALQFPFLPCLKGGGKNKVLYLPPEVCT